MPQFDPFFSVWDIGKTVLLPSFMLPDMYIKLYWQEGVDWGTREGGLPRTWLSRTGPNCRAQLLSARYCGFALSAAVDLGVTERTRRTPKIKWAGKRRGKVWWKCDKEGGMRSRASRAPWRWRAYGQRHGGARRRAFANLALGNIVIVVEIFVYTFLYVDTDCDEPSLNPYLRFLCVHVENLHSRT